MFHLVQQPGMPGGGLRPRKYDPRIAETLEKFAWTQSSKVKGSETSPRLLSDTILYLTKDVYFDVMIQELHR